MSFGGSTRDRQLGASDPAHSAWVDASAGTGKTSVLVQRVLRLLLSGGAPDRILCITFTRAAAAEMSTRIIHRLSTWAVMNDSDLVAALYELTRSRPDSATQARARQLFAQIVDSPAGFRIQTIHAFCQSVLRRFPLEAGLAPHFDLLDDRTAGELLGEAQLAILSEAGRDPAGPLGRALAVLIETMDDRGFAGLIEAAIQDRTALARAIDQAGGVGLLILRVWRGLGLEPDTTPDDLIADACRDGAFDGPGLRTACETLSTGSETDRRRAVAIETWLGAGDRSLCWDLYRDAFLTQEGQPNGTYARTKAHKATAPTLDREAERLVRVCETLRCAGTGRATTALLTVADALFRHYDRAKEARALLDYDDLIDRTRRLIESDAAWVLYKLDGGIDHLLLDEAQDTNPEQWSIVQALAAEFFSGQGARDRTRTIFVVGDGKQSIYSFQGADPTALPRMRAQFERQLAGIRSELRAIDLTTSFRSVQPVLRVVDSVFSDAVAADGVHDSSKGRLEHLVSRVDAPGLVELWPPVVADPEQEEAAPEAISWSPSPPQRQRAPEEILADRIADTIADLLAGSGDAGRVQRFGPGDVMILVRRRTRFVGPMVRALKARRIPVAGIDRLELLTPLAVQDLIALARFVLLPEDDLNLAALLKSPLLGINEPALFDLAWRREGSLWQALLAAAETKPARYEPARAWLAERLARADFTRPFEFFAQVLNGPCPGCGTPGGSGRMALLRRLGPDALDPLDEFLSVALDYERRHAPSLEGFLGWLEAGDFEIKRELAGRTDAVRIVTVHGAKGLEAPIVFLPDTMGLPNAGNVGPRILWHSVDGFDVPYWAPRKDVRAELCGRLADAERELSLREYRRLLYVALTRARDQLYVCGWRGSRTPGEGHWHGLVEAGMVAAGAETIDTRHGPVLRLERLAEIELESEEPVEVAAVRPPDWLFRPAPPEPRPFRPLAPSRPDYPGAPEPSASSPAGPQDAARFRRGRAIHRLLQLLPDLDETLRPAAGLRLLAEFPEGEREPILAQVLSVLADPACAPLFGPGSRAEVPIIGRIGARGIAGRIDRLLVEPGRITIVDFKSGRAPAAADSVPALYLSQMAAYRAVLRQVYPDHAIAVRIVWTDGPAITPIDAAALDPYEAYLTSVPSAGPAA